MIQVKRQELPLSHFRSQENDSAGFDMVYFVGKAVYIDLQRKHRHLEANIKASLKKAGATTEYFFSKKADCIITDRAHGVTSYNVMSAHNSSTARKTSMASPSGTTNILLAAEKLGIPVITLASCKHLFNLTHMGHPHTTSPSLGGKIYQLKPPFFKCEDLSRRYRPLVYQWNTVTLPFESKHSIAKKGGVTSCGYCENCHTQFTDLDRHLGSAKHQSYAENENNFKGIDDCIAAGTSLKDFVAGIRKKFM